MNSFVRCPFSIRTGGESLRIDSEVSIFVLSVFQVFAMAAIGVPTLESIENRRGWVADPLVSQATHPMGLN
jgi:hypothetical protein